MLTSCGTKKFLAKDEYLLKKSTIKINSKGLNKEERKQLLNTLVYKTKYEPNTKYLFFFPRERAALKYRYALDTPNLTTFFMQLDGQNPVFVDTTIVEEKNTFLSGELKQLGYWNGHSSYSIKYHKSSKKASVVFNVEPRQPYRLNQLTYICPDSIVQMEIFNNRYNSFLQKGTILSAEAFEKEKKRLIGIMKDKGYYTFSSNNFLKPYTNVDTANHALDVKWEIQPFSEDSVFVKYKIKDINIFPTYESNRINPRYDSLIKQDMHFMVSDSFNLVKPKFILQKMNIGVGEYYNATKYKGSMLGLNALTTYAYPRTSIIESDSSKLTYNIRLLSNFKYTESRTFDLFFSRIVAPSSGAVRTSTGFGISQNQTINNVFGGSEKFNFGLYGSLEFFTGGDISFSNNIQIGGNTSINLPRFRNVTGFYPFLKFLKPIRLLNINDNFLDDLKRLSNTDYALTVDYQQNQDIYRSFSANINLGDVNLVRNNKSYDYSFTHLGYFNPTRLDSFDVVFSENEFFNRIFQRQLTTSLFLRSIRYVSESPERKNWKFNLQLSLETSGLEISAIQAASKLFSPTELWNEVNFSKYIKTEIDWQPHYTLSKETNLAFRVNAGFVWSYSKSGSIPANTLFAVGGANSLRAWNYQAVGPGAVNSLIGARQPAAIGDLLLQGSIELRSDLFWLLEGALFTDFGNIWTIQDASNTQPVNILDQLAIDAGFGLRLDFDFLIIRLDFAKPVRYWYLPDNSPSHGNPDFFSFKDWRLQFGIGYPF